MKVADIMTKRVVSVHPGDTVERVAEKITERHISGVFVTEDGKLLGQISHRDVLERVFPTYQEFYDDLAHGHDFEAIQTRARQVARLTASEVMTTDVPTVDPDTHVMKVAAWMLLRDLHRLAVVDELGKLVGVISRGDVFYRTIHREMDSSSSRPKGKTTKVSV